ncbi:ribonuclease HI family protein [Massilia sp. CMS3.1]|uniref:ribonuclease HI family protein n=1 Tax=Massilia sp. CMS3.1 TaxID=3373083 RepID=UPI003EE4336B
MTELDRLQGAANRSELAASRKLARRRGLTFADALRATLAASAGEAGLAALLAGRAALREAEAARVLARHTARAAALAAQRTRHDGSPTPWRAWFDGSARPNPGRCGIGARLLGPDGELLELSEPAGYGNSSEAEYLALIAVLEAARRIGAFDLTVYGDSRVVIDDVAASAAKSASALRPLRARVHALLAGLPGASLRWVPRHKNLDADALSQRASVNPAVETDDALRP